jgi:hypothetical protein
VPTTECLLHINQHAITSNIRISGSTFFTSLVTPLVLSSSIQYPLRRTPRVFAAPRIALLHFLRRAFCLTKDSFMPFAGVDFIDFDSQLNDEENLSARMCASSSTTKLFHN